MARLQHHISFKNLEIKYVWRDELLKPPQGKPCERVFQHQFRFAFAKLAFPLPPDSSHTPHGLPFWVSLCHHSPMCSDSLWKGFYSFSRNIKFQMKKFLVALDAVKVCIKPKIKPHFTVTRST